MNTTKPTDYLFKQNIVKDIIKEIQTDPVGITTNSIEITSLLIETIYKQIGGIMGVVFSDNTVFDKNWKEYQHKKNSTVYGFTENINKKLEVEGFRSIEDENFEVATRSMLKNIDGVYLASNTGLNKSIIKKPKPENDLIIKVNEKIKRDALFKQLDAWGYVFSDWCSSKNMYASRGGIVDIFPALHKNPIRLELEGSRVVSLRVFNTVNQESIKEISKAVIHEPLTTKNDFQEQKLKDFFESNVNNILYITSDFDENKNKKIKHFDFFCEKLSKKTLPARLINNKIKKHIDGVTSVFVFRGVKINSDLKNKVVVCDSVFGENIKCPALNAVFFGTPGTTQKHKNITIDNTQQKRVMSLDDIKWGDILVHQDYGLGVYRGLERVGGGNESIKIEYLGGASVFVPLDKFGRIHKYIGPGGSTPKLTKLGSGVWEKQKLTTKKSVDKVVSHLIENFKAKQKPRGFIYRGDDELIQQVVDDFPYTETPDQHQSIKDVYEDMSVDKPMDRLVYGDVGFGKTEVAIRAAILAITSGRGVFFLAPTTVLSNQHYITCVNRLSLVGVRVELLSRFKSKKQQREILENYNKGQIDMLVGTHRLLSDDVKTNNLGLLIVDEEHRFGVKHKEAIRRIKGGVDILTLTATPIPRTLQQSLVGIRDTSKIETPPEDRLPIKTYINRFDWVDIKNKIKYETNRGGQVYFIHNEVESIPFIVEKLSVEFPNLNISGAHGQMASGPLEKIVLGFFEKRVDVIVCTTIVESGLDVKNANTIIINNAQNFGLSQLYQIRGRVGRGDRQAFCYLCIPGKIKLLPDAYQRLKTMEYYTSLGSGYHVATKDLEIRGAGNVFGYEQSGQMLQVGLELYNKILSEAIEKGTGGGENKSADVIISFDKESLIGVDYMPSAHDRLRFYQELVLAQRDGDVENIKRRIVDQFGVVDKPTENLFLVTKIRIALNDTPIKKCIIKSGCVNFKIKKEVKIDTEKFLLVLGVFSGKTKNKHRFEYIGGETSVVFDNIKEDKLLGFVVDFAGLFSGVVVN